MRDIRAILDILVFWQPRFRDPGVAAVFREMRIAVVAVTVAVAVIMAMAITMTMAMAMIIEFKGK